jgi:hypothetical protein
MSFAEAEAEIAKRYCSYQDYRGASYAGKTPVQKNDAAISFADYSEVAKSRGMTVGAVFSRQSMRVCPLQKLGDSAGLLKTIDWAPSLGHARVSHWRRWRQDVGEHRRWGRKGFRRA